MLAFGGAPFQRAMPRLVHMRTGLVRHDWDAVVGDLNAGVGEEIPCLSYFFKVVVTPLCLHGISAWAGFLYFSLTNAVLSVIVIAVLFPVSCCLVMVALAPGRSALAMDAAHRTLADINERYRGLGFDFSLMEKREYARRYIPRPKASQLSSGQMLVVRRLGSHDCCMGGPVLQQHASEVPGEWLDRPRQPLIRRKVPKAIAKRRALTKDSSFRDSLRTSSGARQAARTRRPTGPTVV